MPISSSDPVLAEGSRAIFANEDFYDLCTPRRNGPLLSRRGAGRRDSAAPTSPASATGDAPKVRLPGGGGGAVMLPTARRAVTWRTEHSPRTLVEKLDFVTAAGGMHGVVTPIAVFKRRSGRLALASFHPAFDAEAVRQRTGFSFDASAAEPTAAPTPRETAALQSLDPDGRFEADAAVSLH